ncbi:glutathionylspermidine synthase family protein [Alkalihalobacterium alkalinitrilicum]|uniref:glutathionylspermidine synthase family protein n=1 Tax=Alkalihalobacterium alkalinitrilicum TaxID=427920 RepID=UPI0013035409|nr:glutathionylspermidine synthase family protein [Alkalihalobacterium alkalinitrilicum]
MDKRDAFYSTIPSFWDRLYGEEYALYDCFPIEPKEVCSIRKATNEVYRIYKKFTQMLRHAPDETFIDLGFPEKALPFLKLSLLPYETVIGRFDFVQTEEGLKMIEFNSDTPTFIRELFEVNGLVAEQFGMDDPNDEEAKYLGKALRNSIFHCAKQIGVTGHPYVVFTAHEEDIEDRETMKFLMKTAQIKGAAFVPLHQLKVDAGRGVYDGAGNQIDILYRHTYPLEALLEDVAIDHFPIGIECMNLVNERKVGMLNPASAFLMQSKAVMAGIWGLHEQEHLFFTADEHETIDRYFLPTYLDEEPFIEKNQRYVEKPAFGREGDTIVVRENGKTLHSSKQTTYNHYIKIYQKYACLPKTLIATEAGKKEAHLLIGSFIINEKASAFGYRAGAQITDNLSYFLPCGVKGEREWI